VAMEAVVAKGLAGRLVLRVVVVARSEAKARPARVVGEWGVGRERG
jgi:hypothetical protein